MKEARRKRLIGGFLLYEMSRKGKFIETESGTVIAWGWEAATEIRLQTDMRAFLDDGNTLKLHCDGRTTL